MAAVTPLDFMPSDLNTASLPTQQAANDEGGDGCERQCVISALVKWRLTNVGLCEGTEEISLGVSCLQIVGTFPADIVKTASNHQLIITLA